MHKLDLESRPILPECQFNQDGTPPRIEVDAFFLRSGEYASNCTPSNCPMFTPDLGERPSLEDQTSFSSATKAEA